MTARYAALAPWWHQYTEADRTRALDLLREWRCAALASPEPGENTARKTRTRRLSHRLRRFERPAYESLLDHVIAAFDSRYP